MSPQAKQTVVGIFTWSAVLLVSAGFWTLVLTLIFSR